MPQITKSKYKKDLKDFIRGEIAADYVPGEPNKGLDYWVSFNKGKKKNFDNWLVGQGIEVIEDEQ